MFFDEHIEPAFGQILDGFVCDSVAKLGLQGLSNGALLRWLSEAGYDVFLTKDKGVPFQNSLKKIGIAAVILRGMGELASKFAQSPEELIHALQTVPRGEHVFVSVPKPAS